MAQSSSEKLRDLCRAAGTGDVETIDAWLRTAPDVNAQDDQGRPLLLLLVRGTINAKGERVLNATHVDLARKLLALGADANASNDNRITVLHIASCGRGEEASEMVRLLLLAGADANASTLYGHSTPMGFLPVFAKRPESSSRNLPTTELSTPVLVICKLLLHAGASIDDVFSPDTSMEAWLEKQAKPADDEQWLAVKRLVADVRAAGGTYSAYLHQHRKQVLMLRCLATKKGRATTTDPVMNFLVQLGDNGVIWKVLSFWPPPP